jgi:hypothetical protein
MNEIVCIICRYSERKIFWSLSLKVIESHTLSNRFWWRRRFNSLNLGESKKLRKSVLSKKETKKSKEESITPVI